jgi:hypothetical protein
MRWKADRFLTEFAFVKAKSTLSAWDMFVRGKDLTGSKMCFPDCRQCTREPRDRVLGAKASRNWLACFVEHEYDAGLADATFAAHGKDGAL